MIRYRPSSSVACRIGATARAAPPCQTERRTRLRADEAMNLGSSVCAVTIPNHSLCHGARFTLAVGGRFGEHTKIHSAPLSALELALSPRCYAAADDDEHWNTQWCELPLAALLSSPTAAAQVAAGSAAECCRFTEFPSETVSELAFRPRCYAAAEPDKHWITQRSALTLAALRSVALCCRASSCGLRGEPLFHHHRQESRS